MKCVIILSIKFMKNGPADSPPVGLTEMCECPVPAVLPLCIFSPCSSTIHANNTSLAGLDPVAKCDNSHWTLTMLNQSSGRVVYS